MCFGLLGVIPEIGVLGLKFFLFYPNYFAIDVKDTSSAHPGAQQALSVVPSESWLLRLKFTQR
jgi:hypothetical protein